MKWMSFWSAHDVAVLVSSLQRIFRPFVLLRGLLCFFDARVHLGPEFARGWTYLILLILFAAAFRLTLAMDFVELLGLVFFRYCITAHQGGFAQDDRDLDHLPDPDTVASPQPTVRTPDVLDCNVVLQRDPGQSLIGGYRVVDALPVAVGLAGRARDVGCHVPAGPVTPDRHAKRPQGRRFCVVRRRGVTLCIGRASPWKAKADAPRHWLHLHDPKWRPRLIFLLWPFVTFKNDQDQDLATQMRMQQRVILLLFKAKTAGSLPVLLTQFPIP